MQDLITSVMDGLTLILAELIVSAIVAAIGALYYRVTKTQMDADARERLHSALTTGAAVVVKRDMTEAQKIEALIDYAQASVPDALARLKPKIGVLQNLAISKLEMAIKQ